MPSIDPIYLGDGAYVQFDGSNLILTTSTHEVDFADDVIYLDEEAIDRLLQYL